MGESSPKADSYMVSELVESSSLQVVQDQHLASSLQPNSRVSQNLRVLSIKSDHCILNVDSVKIGYTDGFPRPKLIVRQFFLQTGTQRTDLQFWYDLYFFHLHL